MADAADAGTCGVSADQPVRIALCFYGLFRKGARVALPSIEANLLRQLRRAGGVDVFVHAMLAPVETSGWDGVVAGTALDQDEYKRFDACAAEAELQEAVDREHGLLGIAGRMENYDAVTNLNVVRSRYSVWRAAELVRSRERRTGVSYTHVALARPDTAFLSPVRWEPLPYAVHVPNFGHWGGVIDRFGYGPAQLMLDVFMSQFPGQYDRDGFYAGRGVNSETLMCEHFKANRLHVALTPLCLARVRNEDEVWDKDWQGQGERGRPECMGELFVFGVHDEINPCPTSTGAVANVLRTTEHNGGGVWHLAPAGENRTQCDFGQIAPADACEEAGALLRDVHGEWTLHPFQSNMQASAACGPDSVQGPAGWGGVPRGCSLSVGGDWATRYKGSGGNCNDGAYALVCSGREGDEWSWGR